MKVQIEQVRNGFIVTSTEGKDVIMESGSEVRGYQNMLYIVLEHLGYFGSKHDAERLFIEIKKQKQ